MIRYHITNTTTGNQYAISDSDLAEKGVTIDEWLARKVNAYGHNPTVVAEDQSSAIVAEAQDRLWRESWAWGDRQLASVDRSTIVGWAAMGELTPAGIAKVKDLIRWLDALFGIHYAAAKDAIAQAGEWVEPEWATWPPVPWSWADIIAERTTNAQ